MKMQWETNDFFLPNYNIIIAAWPFFDKPLHVTFNIDIWSWPTSQGAGQALPVNSGKLLVCSNWSKASFQLF